MNPPPRDAAKEEKIESLLQAAEVLLHKDVDKEIELLKGNPRADIGNEAYDKYAKAKKMFEEVLELDPDNMMALHGVSNCELMAGPLPMVQYMVPVQHVQIKAEVLEPPEPLAPPPWETDDQEKKVEPPPVTRPPDEMPWEIVGSARQRDIDGLRYTGQAFGRAHEVAEKEVTNMVEEAKEKVAAGEPVDDVFQYYSNRLQQYQKGLHQGWKGHGPEILDKAMELLRKALGK